MGGRSGVVVVGSFNVDHVWTLPSLPRAGETRIGSYRTGPGGKGFNQATAAARAGAATAFICALGDDSGGQLARRLAGEDGIDLRAAQVDAPTGTAGIHVDHDAVATARVHEDAGRAGARGARSDVERNPVGRGEAARERAAGIVAQRAQEARASACARRGLIPTGTFILNINYLLCWRDRERALSGTMFNPLARAILC